MNRIGSCIKHSALFRELLNRAPFPIPSTFWVMNFCAARTRVYRALAVVFSAEDGSSMGDLWIATRSEMYCGQLYTRWFPRQVCLCTAPYSSMLYKCGVVCILERWTINQRPEYCALYVCRTSTQMKSFIHCNHIYCNYIYCHYIYCNYIYYNCICIMTSIAITSIVVATNVIASIVIKSIVIASAVITSIVITSIIITSIVITTILITYIVVASIIITSIVITSIVKTSIVITSIVIVNHQSQFVTASSQSSSINVWTTQLLQMIHNLSGLQFHSTELVNHIT